MNHCWATPLPNPPPQGGREPSSVLGKNLNHDQKPEPPLSPFPPPLWGRARERGTARAVSIMTNDPTTSTTTRLPLPFPRSSPPCARSARPNCQDSSHAGLTSSTRPAAGHC